jgi:hypothetical protein
MQGCLGMYTYRVWHHGGAAIWVGSQTFQRVWLSVKYENNA